jgi:hypothetical protein
VTAQDPNLAKVELIAAALGPLLERLVFVGGCAVCLPSGAVIRLISAPVFLATKFEAYSDRGQGDMLASHDLEDIINVLDGRPGLLEEVAKSAPEVQAYLQTRFTELLMAPNFMDVLPGMIFPGDSLAERTQLIAESLVESDLRQMPAGHRGLMRG